MTIEGTAKGPCDEREADEVAPIRGAVRVVKIRVGRIHDRRSGDLRRRRIAHALRDRPVGEHAQVVLETTLHREQHRAVVGPPGVVELTNRPVELALLRVLQDQGAALVDVAGRGARSGGPSWDAPKGGDLDDEIPF